LASLSRPNGIVTEYTFDQNGNLELLDHRLGGQSLRSYEYTYDANGMRTSMRDNDGLHEYYYDSLYQIVQAYHPTVSNPLEEFEYDAVGNRVGPAIVHNELNQLLEDENATYQYDADGNMTLRVDKATGDSTKYTWDIENRLVKVEKPGTVVEYVYGPLGRRLAKVVNGVRKEFRYDGEDLIVEMDEQDSVIGSYTFGPGIDQPMQMNRNGSDYYYVADGLGSITAITGNTGVVLQEYKYSVFGEVVEQVGDSIGNPFTYTAREWDGEVGLYYYRHRWYEPHSGSFLSLDPIGYFSRDVNLYRYTGNNPIRYKDPFGLFVGRMFRYGYWGGEGYSGGQTTPLTELTPEERAKLPDPIDVLDALFYAHDYCVFDARSERKAVLDDPCASPQEKREAESTCSLKEALCRAQLGRSLDFVSDDPGEWVPRPPDVEKAKRALAQARLAF
jgi:RHS repeat-associated protein